MVEEINFIDLACLFRITPDTTLEKFGTAINGAFFDASNLAGALKQKSLIDFSSYYPGPNTIVVAEAGKVLMAEAEAKAAEPTDTLDQEILFQISTGKRVPMDLQTTLNIRSKDLALHIYKLSKQGLLIYELKSGGVDLQLTEAGFIKAKAAHPAPIPTTPTPQMATPPQAAQQPAAQMQPEAMQMAPKPKGSAMTYILIAVVLIVVAALIYYLHFVKHVF